MARQKGYVSIEEAQLLLWHLVQAVITAGTPEVQARVAREWEILMNQDRVKLQA